MGNDKKEKKKTERISDSGSRDDDDDGAVLDEPKIKITNGPKNGKGSLDNLSKTGKSKKRK